MRCLTVSAALLTLIAFSQVRAEEPARSKLTLKATGDSVFELAVEASLTPVPDIKTARGIVEAWTAIADESGSPADAPSETQTRVEGLLAKAIGDAEAAVLSEALAEAQTTKRANPEKRELGYEFKRLPAEVIEEAEQSDGSLWIVTSQKSEAKMKNRAGEWETSNSETRMRYTMMKGEDGRWRINSIEQAEQEEKIAKSSDARWNWSPYRDYRREVVLEMTGLKLAKPEMKTATPEEVASSFANTLRHFNNELAFEPLILVCRAVIALSDDWFTAEYKGAIAKRIEERAAKKKPDDPPLEVEEVSEKTDASATVIFKVSDNKATSKLVVKVIKEGGAWQVSEVGDLRNIGKTSETYEAKTDIYRRW